MNIVIVVLINWKLMLNADSVVTHCGIKSRLVLIMEKLCFKCKCLLPCVPKFVRKLIELSWFIEFVTHW